MCQGDKLLPWAELIPPAQPDDSMVVKAAQGATAYFHILYYDLSFFLMFVSQLE